MIEREARQKDAPVYELQFERRAGYLYARYSGPAEVLEATLKTWSRIGEECLANNYNKVLAVEDLATELTYVGKFIFASKLPALGFRAIKVAFVDCHPDQAAANSFSEELLGNARIRFKVFPDTKSAELWLLYPGY